MYVLKIQNTIKTQDEIFVYEDKNVHFSNLLRSITNDILDTMIYMCIGQYAPLTDKTFRQCAKTVATKYPEEMYLESTILRLFQQIQSAPDDVIAEVKELIIESQESNFKSTGNEYVNNGFGGQFGTVDYYFDWTIYDDNTYTYEVFFNCNNGTLLNVSLQHKDGFDIPPIVDNETFYY